MDNKKPRRVLAGRDGWKVWLFHEVDVAGAILPHLQSLFVDQKRQPLTKGRHLVGRLAASIQHPGGNVINAAPVGLGLHESHDQFLEFIRKDNGLGFLRLQFQFRQHPVEFPGRPPRPVFIINEGCDHLGDIRQALNHRGTDFVSLPPTGFHAPLANVFQLLAKCFFFLEQVHKSKVRRLVAARCFCHIVIIWCCTDVFPNDKSRLQNSINMSNRRTKKIDVLSR